MKKYIFEILLFYKDKSFILYNNKCNLLRIIKSISYKNLYYINKKNNLIATLYLKIKYFMFKK